MNSNRISKSMLAVFTGIFFLFQTPVSRADIVSTQAITANSDKATIQSFLDRADVRAKLESLGVNESVAQQRVAALNDWEAHLLAQKIDSLPAGGNINLSNSEIIIILLAAILLVLVL